MPRQTATSEDKRRGAALGRALADHRLQARRSAEHVAGASGISVETVRRIEQGRVPNPGIFTVAAIARTLAVGLDDLASAAAQSGHAPQP